MRYRPRPHGVLEHNPLGLEVTLHGPHVIQLLLSPQVGGGDHTSVVCFFFPQFVGKLIDCRQTGPGHDVILQAVVVALDTSTPCSSKKVLIIINKNIYIEKLHLKEHPWGESTRPTCWVGIS